MTNHLSSNARVMFLNGGFGAGGDTTYLFLLAGELSRRGVACSICSFDRNAPFANILFNLGIKVSVYDPRQLIFEEKIEKALVDIAAFKPSTVVANMDNTSYEVLRYIPSGVNRVGVCHANDPNTYTIFSKYAEWLDQLAGVSPHIVTQLAVLPEFQYKPVHYLSSGVQVPKILPQRNYFSESPLRIVYFGRLEQEAKRVRLFPQILQQLIDSGIPFQWTIAGDGSERAFLEARMKSASPTQQVCFVGVIPYNELPELLSNHDVYLLTSEFEGGPLSLLEAMAYGVVPVVSDLPSCIRQAVDSETGFLVDPNDIDGYAAAIIYLHNHREELAEKAPHARERILAHFSAQAWAQQWLDKVILSQPDTGIKWPSKYKIEPPLGMEKSLLFSAPGRLFRKLRRTLALPAA